MIINLLKSWIKENENKINNLFLYSFTCPMKITESYKNIDENGKGQTFRDLKKFLNTNFTDEDLNSIEVQIDTSETEGIVLFEYKFNDNESYFYSSGNKKVKKFSKNEFFNHLNVGLEQGLKLDNWIKTFGHRYVTILSKNELNLLYTHEINLWQKRVKPNFKKEYEKFQSQPTEWNEGISKLLDLLLNDQLISLESHESLTDITSNRFEQIKLKSFICEAPEIEQRIPQEKRTSIPDICIYIYAIINVPENDSLDTMTTMLINDWITNNIKLIDINSIFEFLTSFPFNFVNNNFCIITTEIIGMNKEDFDKHAFHGFSSSNNIKIKNGKAVSKDKLETKDFIQVLNKKHTPKLDSDNISTNLGDFDMDFIFKCNRLVCALLSELSENKTIYNYKLINPDLYLLKLCKDFNQYKSLVKSLKINFNIINEVPEQNLISMRDVYHYVNDIVS